MIFLDKRKDSTAQKMKDIQELWPWSSVPAEPKALSQSQDFRSLRQGRTQAALFKFSFFSLS